MSGKTVLITGGTGHVGRETVRQAIERGWAVLATFRSGTPEPINGVQWLRLDLRDRDQTEKALGAIHIDCVIHTAAAPNEEICRPDPLGAIRANVDAVAILLDQARRKNWGRLINVSTGSVFQNSSDESHPILEDTPPSVTNVYSTTKACGEMLTRMFRTQYGLSAATARISWVYGPPLLPANRSNPRGPIPWFLRCAMRGEAINEKSGGDFAASFTHVSDVAAGLLALAASPTLNHDVYHVGSGINFTTHQVADAVRAACPGVIIEIGPGTAPWTDHTKMRAPLAGTKLFDDTGFRPALGLSEGIRHFANWIRNHPGSYQ